VKQLELAETIEALRAELARAAAAGAGAGFQFPVAGVQLEFHVAVTKTGEGRAGVKFWVVELGRAGSYAREGRGNCDRNLDTLKRRGKACESIPGLRSRPGRCWATRSAVSCLSC